VLKALPKRGSARHAAALMTSVATVALVTASIYALDSFAPVLSLGVLYLFAVLPVAVLFGLAWAIPVSVASMLAFNWFFLPPKHTLRLTDGENWIALAVFLVTAVVVSVLAARSRAREEEARKRALEASLLAQVAGALLESEHVQSELRAISERVAEALGVAQTRIELGSVRRPDTTRGRHHPGPRPCFARGAARVAQGGVLGSQPGTRSRARRCVPVRRPSAARALPARSAPLG